MALYVSSDSERLDALKVEAALLAPGEKSSYGPYIGLPRVSVPDGGGEELEESPGGMGDLTGDDRRREGLEGDVSLTVLGNQQLGSGYAVLYNIIALYLI